MDSRMDKYNSDKPTLKKRTDKNKELYAHMYDNNSLEQNYDNYSNMTVINTDSRVIDVDKIRDMLDRKYRVSDERKPLMMPEDEVEEIKLTDTKEYDINTILEKAKKEKNFDYEKERLKSIHNTQYDILKKLNIETENQESNKKEDEENLVNLINTITALELKNRSNQQKQDAANALELLSDLKDDDTDEVQNTEIEDEEEKTTEEKILDLNKNDYDDFEELKNDIKSNSILIKIVSILFVLILLVGALIIANNYFDLGLF